MMGYLSQSDVHGFNEGDWIQYSIPEFCGSCLQARDWQVVSIVPSRMQPIASFFELLPIVSLRRGDLLSSSTHFN